jgi:hypothetical protein
VGNVGRLLLGLLLFAIGGCTSTYSPTVAEAPPYRAVNVSAPAGAIRSPAFGSCECPYDFDSAGNVCASRSAYLQGQASRPECYTVDLRGGSEPAQSQVAATALSPTGQTTPGDDDLIDAPTPSAATQPTSSSGPSYSSSGPSYSSPSAPAYHPPSYSPTCAENGSCYGDISSITGRPKTTHVHGYFRKNGTYVRGHYRS